MTYTEPINQSFVFLRPAKMLWINYKRKIKVSFAGTYKTELTTYNCLNEYIIVLEYMNQ